MKKLFVVFAAAGLLVAFAGSAIAADWGFYGSMRFQTFWESDSKDVQGTFSDDDLTWEYMSSGTTRIGANVKAGDIGGRFEYGHKPASNYIFTRLLYGTWNFGAGQLLVGQDYTPFYKGISKRAWGDGTMSSYGNNYTSRVPQIKLKIAGFQLGLLSPSTVAPASDPGTDKDTTLPRIELRYDLKVGPVDLGAAIAYGTYDTVVRDAAAETEKDYGVDSFLYRLTAKYGAGPFTIAANVFAGTNPANYGVSTGSAGMAADSAVYNAASDSIEDSEVLGYVGVVGFKMSDTVAFEAGYGRVSCETDVAGIKTEGEETLYYVQAEITLAKGMMIIPEIGNLDYGDTKVTNQADVKNGDTTFYGAKWQINF